MPSLSPAATEAPPAAAPPPRVAPLARRRAWPPRLASFAALLVGVVNLVSTLTPNLSWRGHVLLALEGVDAVPIFHALALPAGAGLCLASFYLARRRWRAWQAAMGLLVLLGLLNLLKGLDFEEAAASWAVAGVLWWRREAFTVRHERLTLRGAFWRLPLLGLTAIVVAAIAVYASAPRLGIAAALRQIGDLLVWQAGPEAFHGVFAWLPLGVGLMSAWTLLTAAYLVFRPIAAPHGRPEPSARRLACDLVRAHGEDTLSFFKLREDKQYLFSPDGEAFVGYRTEGGCLLVSGDPVGPPAALPALVRDVSAFAEERGLKLGVVGASERSLPLWELAGLRSLYMGDEAMVDVRGFSLDGRPIRKVRQSVSRLAKGGYTAEVHALSALDDDALDRLEEVLERGREGAPERGFSMAMDSLRGEHLAESLVVLARDADGEVRGVLHFVPCYRRPAMSLSFMRRDPDTPNGLTEFLVVRAIELLREREVEEISLNFAAFARWLHSPGSLLERVLGRVIALANPFFQIESLYRFNAKFFPRWEPRYLLYMGAVGLPRVGLAAMWVECQLPKPSLRPRPAAA